MTNENTQQGNSEEKKSRTRKIIAAFLIFDLVVIICFLTWLYTGSVSSAKESVFKAVPLPVALVESKHINSKQLFQRVQLATDLLQDSTESTENLPTEVLNQLIEARKTEILAADNNVLPSDEDLDMSYQAVLNQLPSQSEEELAKELDTNYGISISTFKNEVLKQTATRENLSLWFNSQENLNPESYTKARELLNNLDNGSDFEQVATQYSEDIGSQAFAGDSGFVNYSDLLPEFQVAVSELALNDNVLVASRFGIHILRITGIEESEAGEKSYNLQQIFIAPSDFEAWLQTEFSKIKSVKLL
ncbi:MAG TPA: peptidylprolyl isomerase [Candidatus Doudnabacteria bacterium]|nr:peptidylprolyl isomerase [Candidatus Doudnabacteria bacterium]